MATKKVYDACCRKLRLINLYSLNQHGQSKRYLKPDLKKLFGEKLIIDDRQMQGCGKAEKRRHLYEDRILRFLYLENQSYNGFPVEK